MNSEGVTTEGAEVAKGRLLEVWPQKCVFVVEEILKTEQDYVTSLKQIIEGYLKPMHSHLFEHAESPISIAAVFGNITQLHEFNTALEEELKASLNDPAAFGQVFVRNRDKFMYYSEYCTHYKSAVKYLEQLIDNNPHLGAFIAQCQKNLHHTFSLQDRLLKPVQRILKYQLLLENLLKPLSPDHCGYSSISGARTSMTEVADRINKMVKVQEVYSALHNNEATVPLKKMTSDRELVHEGVCRIGRSREIELVLFQKLLLFFRKEADGSYTYEDHILAGELCIEEDSRDKKHFTISSTKQTTKKYSLHVQLSDDRQIWMDKIGQMKTDAWQNIIALERKKTVQNLSRLKLQASRRESMQSGRQNRLGGRLSVPGQELDTEQQPQERALTTVGKLQRVKAVRLRKVLSSDCTSTSSSWLTSNQWRPLSPCIGASHSKLTHTSHILQTDQEDTNGIVSPQADNIHVAMSINVTEGETKGMRQCPPDVGTCLSDNSPEVLNQLPEDRPHPPKPDDEPHPQDIGAHQPDVRPHPHSPDSRVCPEPSSNSRPHPPCDHDNEIVERRVPCEESLLSQKTLNGKHRINVTDYLLRTTASSSQSDQCSNQLELPPSPGHLKTPVHSNEDEPSDVNSLSNTAEQQPVPILYDCDSLDEQRCILITPHAKPFHK